MCGKKTFYLIPYLAWEMLYTALNGVTLHEVVFEHVNLKLLIMHDNYLTSSISDQTK